MTGTGRSFRHARRSRLRHRPDGRAAAADRDTLEGFDISAAMLQQGRAKAVYDRLDKADLQSLVCPPAERSTSSRPPMCSCISARSERIVASVAAALAPGGLFAFSVETP